MGDYGAKVTKATFDVSDAAVKDQIFNSSFANFKIVLEDLEETVVASGSGVTTKSVAHGLDYIPAFLAWTQLANTGVSYFNACIDIVTGPPNMTGVNVYTDATNINFQYQQSTTAGEYTAKTYYYILADIGA